MLTFLRTCDTHACCVTSCGLGGVGDVDVRESVTSWVGWGGVGDVDVRENLRHMLMLRLFLGGVGWGMLMFVRTKRS